MIENISKNSNKKSIALLIVYSLLAMVVAFYNGFPLVEDDTGAYIQHAFKLQLPSDRTPFYGIFLGITSLHSILWLTVFFQCLLLCYLLRRYIGILFGAIDGFAEAFCFIVIISFTCLSWVVSYLMPDVFTGILMLAALLYLFDTTATTFQRYIYLTIIFLSVIIHNSHFFILAIFSFLLIIHAIINKKRVLLIRNLLLLGISIFFWFSMCMINQYKGHGFVFSRGSHVFLMGKLAENGILTTYLRDNCGKENLKLCPYKDQIPAYSWEFIWNYNGPLYKTGGWDSNRVEYNHIIREVLTTPKYLNLFIQKSIESTCKELVQVQAPDKTSALGSGSQAWAQIDHFYHDELNEYSTSRQTSRGDGAGICNSIYCLFFVLSSLWMLFFYRHLGLGKEIGEMYVMIILFLIINAFVTSTFSAILDRYQNRVFWILPATNAIIIAKYYFTKYANVSKINITK